MDEDSGIKFVNYNLELLSKRLLELRVEKKLSQSTIARLINVPRSTVAAWECGERLPDAFEAKMLALLYAVSLNYLLGFTDQNAKQ